MFNWTIPIPHKDEFIDGVRLSIEGECKKAGAYVKHGGSLGAIREKIIRKMLRDETPDRYRVETGFIRHCDNNNEPDSDEMVSRQCDILIHDCTSTAPFYRYEDLVVVDAGQAKGVVEVKSRLEKAQIEDLLTLTASIKSLAVRRSRWIPVMGYGIEGATIATIADHFARAVRDDKIRELLPQDEYPEISRHANWPDFIAVQERQIFGIKPHIDNYGTPIHFCLLDFSQNSNEKDPLPTGLETGEFLYFYNIILSEDVRFRYYPNAEGCYQWFNNLPLKENGKFWINQEGEVHQGNISLPEDRR